MTPPSTPAAVPRYLEGSLKREIGFDEDIAARNRIRMLLTTFFTRRDCACLQRPVIDEGDLAHLGKPAEGSPRPAATHTHTHKDKKA